MRALGGSASWRSTSPRTRGTEAGVVAYSLAVTELSRLRGDDGGDDA
jgi:hypothetical protein